MGFQVPSPPHASKSPNGGKVPTFEPQEGIKIWLIFVEVGYRLLYAKQFLGLVLRVGFGFLLNPTLKANTHNVPSHLRSIHAISIIENMEVGTYHFTRVPTPKSQV